MLQTNHDWKQPIQLTAALALAAGIFWAAPAFAVTFSAPDGVSPTPPQPTRGGASRNGGQCSVESLATEGTPTPLLPENTDRVLTVADRPAFFVYVPKTTATEASFTLKNHEDEIHYQTKVDLPESGGIISIPLPETEAELQVGNTYAWLFEIHCEPEFDPNNPTIVGSVQRTSIDATVARSLAEQTTVVETAQIYGDAGIWYETLSTLADARIAQPNEPTLVENWQDLLVSAGLEAIASEPIVR
ncbi:MAG: DUF928 domain-containing protein [Cyanobacteriota bacterium]|nr:DUF928 domain-containing protein [Cyanobacteriota bacterium]